MPLTSEQLAIADKILEARILRAVGQAYEDLFVDVMSRAEPGFRPVKPQGPLGDKKNDGYSADSGRYFQVYSPEVVDPGKALTKLNEDFAGLYAYWNSLARVTEYYFVVNDKYQGVYASLEAALLGIKSTHGLKECRPFLNRDLSIAIHNLSDRNLYGVLGHIPSPDQIGDLDYSVFTDVLRHVSQNGSAITPQALLQVPDFSEKILMNGISPRVESLLIHGNLQSGAVEGFFRSHGTFSKTAIRDKLAQMYQDERTSISRSAGGLPFSGDATFFGLLASITAENTSKQAQDAAMILIGYFFETCDVYEHPDANQRELLL